MNRLIIFVALSTASLLAAYAEGVVDVPWSFTDAAQMQSQTASIKAEVAAQAASHELAMRRAIWHWAASH